MASAHAFAFAIDTKTDETRIDLVTKQAKATFGEKAKILSFEKVRGGQIRFFTKRGVPVRKRSGRFFITLPNGAEKELLCAMIDIPIDYFTRGKALAVPADEMVDLTSLADEVPADA